MAIKGRSMITTQRNQIPNTLIQRCGFFFKRTSGCLLTCLPCGSRFFRLCFAKDFSRGLFGLALHILALPRFELDVTKPQRTFGAVFYYVVTYEEDYLVNRIPIYPRRWRKSADHFLCKIIKVEGKSLPVVIQLALPSV